MKRILSVLAAVLIIFASLPFAAFAQDGDDILTGTSYTPGYDTEYYSRFKDDGITLYVYNWGEYISDGSDDSVDVIAEFENLTGINVEYTTFDTNEALYSKLKSGSVAYDVIIPSDYMISRLIESDMLAEINLDNIPNYAKYIDDKYKSQDYDPDNKYSVMYMWGIVGIIYNAKYVTKPVTSWDILWDTDYAGKILMINNSRDAFGIAAKKLGQSLNTVNEDEIHAQAAALAEQKGVVQAYVMDAIFDKMTEENAWIAPYYAGDYLTMKADNDNLEFCIPEEGTNYFNDGMCIPANSAHKEAAEMFINFMCEPEIGAANAEYIGYSTPNAAALELLGEEITSNEYAYPSAEVMANTENT